MTAKPSLKALAGRQSVPAPEPVAPPPASYPRAATRINTRQLSAHLPAADVKAFRIMAEENDMDISEMLAEACNMVFERYGKPNRIALISGRRKRD
jgi:hypothetical protein